MASVPRTARDELPPPTRLGEEFRTIAEAMPQLAWTAGPDGMIDYLNRRWIEYTGVNLQELHRRAGDVGVIHPDELDDTWRLWREALQSGTPYEHEYRIRRGSDGSYRWFLARAVPIRADDGTILRWIGTATDIDEQRRARDHLRFMVDAGNALSSSLDADRIAQALAQVAVDHFADWSFVMLRRGGRFATVAVAHRDPERKRYIEQYRDAYPIQDESPTVQALLRNEPLLIERVPPDVLEKSAQDEEHLRLLKLLEMHSVLVVPLAAPNGTVLGAMSLASSESRRLFTKEDLEVAKAVAERAALVLENARLFEEEHRAAELLRFTGRVNQLLFETADPWQAMERVARIVAAEVADACAIIRLVDDTIRTEIIVHRDPAADAAIAGIRGHRMLRLGAETELARRLRQHQTIVFSEEYGSMKTRAWPYLAREVEALGAKETVIVPWHAGESTYGALVAYYSAHQPGRKDIELLEEVARRASVAVDRAETLERERRIATTLQQASLPSLIPRPKGLRFDAVYMPAGTEAEVGGDWYDALELDDGSVVVSVGDVTGRGIQAAAIMSKVRHAMGMTPLHETDPARILDSAGWFLGKRYPDAIVTAFVAVISPDRRTMRFANAGHPLPILRRDDDLIELHASGLPLGLRQLFPPEKSAAIDLQPDDILLLYTDGLIEGRREWEQGESILREVLKSDLFAASTTPAKLAARACLPPEVHDDVAILAVSVSGTRAWNLALDDARAAVDARSHFVEFLRGIECDESFIDSAELVFGELLGNVVRHAPGPVEISIDLSPGALVLHVIDSGPPLTTTEHRLPDDELSERGRGLFIVSRLASDVRVEHLVNCGNHISVTLCR